MTKTRNNTLFSELGTTINKFEYDFTRASEKGMDYLVAFIFGSCQEYINKQNEVQCPREDLIWPSEFKALDLGVGILMGFVVDTKEGIVNDDTIMTGIYICKHNEPVKVFTLDKSNDEYIVRSRGIKTNNFGRLDEVELESFLLKTGDIIKAMNKHN